MSNASSLVLASPVRAGFHAALAQIEAYPVERNWRPAFLTPLSTLPQPRRLPLADLQGARPQILPFTRQPLTITQAVRELRSQTLSVRAIVEQMLAAIDRRQPALNAFIYVTPVAELYRQAEILDAELHAGYARGPLHGIPIAVKDLLDVAGMPNTASSPVLDDHISTSDAGSVHLLKAAERSSWARRTRMSFRSALPRPKAAILGMNNAIQAVRAADRPLPLPQA